MRIQDIINELEEIKKEHGNLPLVTPNPYEGYGYVKEVIVDKSEAEIRNISEGYYNYKAIKLPLF